MKTAKTATSILSAIGAYGLGVLIVAAVGSSLQSSPSAQRAAGPIAAGQSDATIVAAQKKPVAADWQPFQLAGEITIIRSDGETTNVIAPPTVLDLNAPLQALTLEQATGASSSSSAASAKPSGPRVFIADGATSFGGAGGDSPDLVAPRYYSFDDHVVEAITRLNRGEEGNPRWAKRTTVRPLY